MIENISSRALLAKLTIHRFHNFVTDKKVTKDVEAQYQLEKTNNRYVKTLFPPESQDAIQLAAGRMRSFYYGITLPWNDDGTRILPSMKFLVFREGFRERQDKFNEAVTGFINQYDYWLNRAQLEHKALFDPKLYPSAQALRDKYGIDMNFLPFPDVGDFRVSVGDEIRAETEAKIMSTVGQAVDSFSGELRAKLKALINRWTIPQLVSLKDQVLLIPAMNLTNDAWLRGVYDALATLDTQATRAELEYTVRRLIT